MTAAAWILALLLFAVGMAGAIIPVLPGVLAIYAAFFVYGWMASTGFSAFGPWFWVIETTLLAVIFLADYAIGAWGVKKFGGSRASVIGSTIGLLIGPFVIPAMGLLIGPFLGAALGELIAGGSPNQAWRAGAGALVGFFSSTVAKLILQSAMIIVFLIWVL